MCELDRLRAHREEIYRIARKHRAKKLYVFGSCARKEENPESDIDFLADFRDSASVFDHFNLENELADFLHRHVDVVEIGALQGDFFEYCVRKDMVAL